jgi:hypothetical protein
MKKFFLYIIPTTVNELTIMLMTRSDMAKLSIRIQVGLVLIFLLLRMAPLRRNQRRNIYMKN